MNQHEACESCRFLMWLRSVSAMPHLVHGVLVASLALVPGKALQLGKRGELCCGCVTQFLREIIVFSPLNLPETPATATHPPIHPSSLSETWRSQRYQRVSFHESHHQRQLPGFHGNSPLQGRQIGGGMRSDAAGYYGDWSDSLHKYSLCASVAPRHIPPYN